MDEYQIATEQPHDEEDRESAYEHAALLALTYRFQLLTTVIPTTGQYVPQS